MIPPVLDPFTYSNGDLESVSSGVWDTIAGSWEIISNEAFLSTDNTSDCICVHTTPVGTPDQLVEADVDILNFGTSPWHCIGVLARCNGSNTFYAVILRSDSDSLELYKAVGGSTTTLATSNFAGSDTAGRVGLQVLGTSIKVFWNGAEAISITDSSITVGDQAGITGWQDNPGLAQNLDNWSANLAVGEVIDDFTDTNGDPWNSSIWRDVSATDSGVIDIQSNAGRMEAEGAAYAHAHAEWIGGDGLGDVDVTATFTLDSTSEQYPGIVIRHDGAWDSDGSAMNGYQAFLDTASNAINILEANSGTDTLLDFEAGLSLITGRQKIRIQAIGSAIKMKWWVASVAEPSGWQIEVTDSTHATGGVALMTYNGGSSTARTVYWESFISNLPLDEPEPPADNVVIQSFFFAA